MIARRSLWLTLLAAGVITCGQTPGAAACRLAQVAALPVRLTSSRILLDGRINGQPVEIILDTGAQTSMVFADAARRLGLVVDDASGSQQMYGAGGGFSARRVWVRDLSLGDSQLKGVTLWAGSRAGRGFGAAALLLGQDVLQNWDVEYDLQHGAVRLFHPDGCRGDEVVYWAAAYAKARMQHTMGAGAAIDLDVGLNHATVAAILDTGAPESVITPEAAARAGLTRPMAEKAGAGIGGLGSARAEERIAELDTLSIGGEVVQHPRLPVADIFVRDVQETTGSLVGERVDMPDMVLGLDFVRAHRVMVAPDQKTVYFTYAGGPIFAPGDGTAK